MAFGTTLKNIAAKVFARKEPSGFEICLKEKKQMEDFQAEHGMYRKMRGGFVYQTGLNR